MSPARAAAPHRLGRYQLRQRLAVGGMAEVWLARQEGPAGFQKDLVVKKILPHLAEDTAFVEMFLNEARLAAALNHPNLVQIFELGEQEGVYFMVMEYVHGRNLRTVKGRCRDLGIPLPAGFLTLVVASACEGLHYAHELRDVDGRPLHLVHRDVSPENILVSLAGQTKIVDFGIAKAAAVPTVTRTGMLKGKFSYISPEHAQGCPLDRRADVYSLGVVLYELLGGVKPFQAPTELAILKAIVEDSPASLSGLRPDLSPELVQIVERAMAKNREARYASARDLGRDLERWAQANDGGGQREVAAFMARILAEDEKAAAASGKRPPGMPPPLPAAALLEAGDALAPDIVPTAAETDPRIRGLSSWPVVLAAGVPVVVSVALAAYVTRRTPPEPVATTPPTVAAPQAQAPPVVPPPPNALPDLRPAEVAPSPEPPRTAVRGSSPAHPKAVVRGKGRVILRVNPWADVAIDGRALGMTPLKPVEVEAGRHTLTLSNVELKKSKSLPIEVRPGQDLDVRVDLFE